MDLPARILAGRAEALAPLGADVVSARALAPLPRLLPLVARHLAPGGVAVLPKGASWRDELTEARRAWHMAVERRPSATHPDAVLLLLSEIARAD